MSNVQPPGVNPASNGSTGPRTEAGKSISSQNARKHDLCSRTLRLEPEEWVEYNDMHDRYVRDLQPADAVEQNLLDEICFNYWRLQQARDAEFTTIENHPAELRLIALYIRYRTSYERGFYKALDQLQKLQRDRGRQTITGSDSRPAVRSAEPPSAPAAHNHAAETALHLEDELETHLLENKVRAELALPPLDIPAELAGKCRNFVSQNSGTLPEHLTDLFRKAA